jgi:acetyl-CoA C-acetyltransferase
MREAVIVSTARTPIAKAHRGSFNLTKSPTMAAHAIRHALLRAGIEGAEVEDVMVGCAMPAGTSRAPRRWLPAWATASAVQPSIANVPRA